MHLVIDVGNTNIDCGIFPASKGNFDLKATFRISTPKVTTTDEFAVSFMNMLHYNQIEANEITHAIFSSVVPPINHNITKMMGNYFHRDILQVTPRMFQGLKIYYEKSSAVGMDRLVNVRAASVLYGQPAVIVDFGTATTIDVVSANSEYLGGLIIPGIAISLDSLVSHTSQLPKVGLELPRRVIGQSTKEAMQNGVYYLNCFGVDAIISRIIEEEFAGKKCHVVATGGLSSFISRKTTLPMKVEPRLLLMGLKILLDEHQD